MKKRMKGKRRGARILLSVLAILLTAGAGLGLWGYACLRPYTKEKMDLRLMDISGVRLPSTLYAYDPASRASRTGDLHTAAGTAPTDPRLKIYVPYEELPEHLVSAFVAIEDKRFWEHGGVDIVRTAHAGLNYLRGQATFGGSTITQQLIKNLTGNDDHSPERKLGEIFSALDLEKHVSKERILETYLNVINLAEGCFGVGAAAERYFSKSVGELTLPECATIAAITNHPARYDPITHPQENRTRRDLILRQMQVQGYITAYEMEEALQTETVLVPHPIPTEAETVTSWYADMVTSDVLRDLQTRLGYSYPAAALLVAQGGLRIETAMDEELQRIVSRYYEDTEHFPVGDHGRPQSSFILIDPHTGDVLAVAGAVGVKSASRLQSYATDTRRPAGSCIKPLTVYAPALDAGIITWASIYEDAPTGERSGVPWPANADGLYRGRVTVAQALAHSLNPVSVRILEELGLRTGMTYARDRLGMQSLIPADGSDLHDLTLASLALGQQSRGVTVRELTAAYTAFTDGIYRPPVSYHRVLDREGNVLLENKPVGEGGRALSRENAAIMTRLLTTVTTEGTAARYITLTEKRGIETAGKTGTTQHSCDRWFVGYTPRLLGGVWMGYDYPTELSGIRGNPCVSIWDDLFNLCEAAYRGAPPHPSFDVPEGIHSVELCPLSGGLVSPFCAEGMPDGKTVTGWFVRGTEPRELCSIHREPPIHVVPADPQDPDRIPLLPNDILPLPETEPETAPPPASQPADPWYSRWFSFFSRWGSSR